LNRAAVVLCVSAWESYVEEVAKEAIEALPPAGIADGAWLAMEELHCGQCETIPQ
jgi:hypothetical protein